MDNVTLMRDKCDYPYLRLFPLPPVWPHHDWWAEKCLLWVVVYSYSYLCSYSGEDENVRFSSEEYKNGIRNACCTVDTILTSLLDFQILPVLPIYHQQSAEPNGSKHAVASSILCALVSLLAGSILLARGILLAGGRLPNANRFLCSILEKSERHIRFTFHFLN